MKKPQYFLIICIIIISYIQLLFSQHSEEYRKALHCLDNKNGEVYFQCTVNDQSELQALTNTISIDRLDDHTVYAYANKREFLHFLKFRLPYIVLPHPGYSLKDPPMSDYNDPGPLQVDKYPTYDGYINLLSRFQSDFPDLCTVDTIGESIQNRLILAAKISDEVHENEMEPIVSNTGAVHGNETLGFMFVFKLMDIFLNEYGTDEQITRLVDSLEFWFVPMINPDGVYKGGNNTVSGASRANANRVDLNRNYPDIVSGPQSPEKENLVSMAFDAAHNITFSLDFHAGGSGVGYPYCRTKKQPPDSLWYEQEGKRYADYVQAAGPSGYFDDFGGKGYGNGYLMLANIRGIRVDYVPYYCHCLCYGFELTKTKLIPESEFLTYWGYHREALLSAFEQVLFGIRGTVTDSITNEGIQGVKILINDNTTDSMHFYSNNLHGDFYRPIFRGTYSLTFIHDDYHTRKIEDVHIEDQSVTVVNVQLFPKNTSSDYAFTSAKTDISIVLESRGIRILFNEIENLEKITIFNLSGREVWSTSLVSSSMKNSIVWNGTNNRGQQVSKGCYFIGFQTKNTFKICRFTTF